MILDLSEKPVIRQARHWFAEVNQLYHPTGKLGQDRWGVVYSKGLLNTTKFDPILLKEWFYLVAQGGQLIVDYQPSDPSSFQELEENMWWLWKCKYEILYHGLAEKGTMQRFICRKIQSTTVVGDSIDKWSFGIITNGKRKDLLERIIQAVKNQNIPNYEIIVCGTYYDRKEKHFRYIPFNQRDDQGWITRKKNIIAQHAQYENLCIVHDRMLPDKNWYQGMKKWGNCFEVLSVIQKQETTGDTGNHWEYFPLLVYKKISRYLVKPLLHFSARLDSQDWFENIILYGQVIICKRKVLLACPQNETMYWQSPEDHVFSQDLLNSGYIPRLNNFSVLVNLDTKKWLNDTQLVYSSSNQLKFVGPVLKLACREIITRAATLVRPYKII